MRKKEHSSIGAFLLSLLLHILLFGGLIAFSFYEIKPTQTGGEEKGNAVDAVMVNTEVLKKEVIKKHQAAIKREQQKKLALHEAELAKLKADIDAKRQIEEAKVKAEMEAKRQAEEARVKAEMEAQRQAEEARVKAEIEAKRQAEEARLKAEMEAKRQAEEAEEKAKLEAKLKEQEAKRLMEQAEKQKIAELKRKALEKKNKAIEIAKRKKAEAKRLAKLKAAQEAQRKSEEDQLDAVRDFESGDFSLEGEQINGQITQGNSRSLGDKYGGKIKRELERRFIKETRFANKVCTVEVVQDRNGNIVSWKRLLGSDDICASALRAVALTKKLPKAPSDRIFQQYRKFPVDFKL